MPSRLTRSPFPLLNTLLAAAALTAACQRPTYVEQTRTASAVQPAAAMQLSHGASHDMSHPAAQQAPIGKGVAKELAEVKKATSRYQRFETAQSEGYTTQVTACWENQPIGAMGFHYGNTALFDGRVEANRPEVLLYERARNGKMELVGVEWIIPFDQWHSSEPPKLLGQPLMRNLTFNVWALHAWIWKDNPAGVFADWNPNVKCWPE